MLMIKIDTSKSNLFISDSGQQTAYSRAQGLQDVFNQQILPCVALGKTQGKLYDQHGMQVGIWKDA